MRSNTYIRKDKFIHDLKVVINHLYQIAYNQGFNEWTYNLKSKDIIILDYSFNIRIDSGSSIWEK